MTTTNQAAGERITGPDIAPGISAAELFSVDDVAALLRCSPRHVYRLADAGKMPRPIKLGALVRWKRAELTAWVAEGCPAVRTVKGAAR